MAHFSHCLRNTYCRTCGDILVKGNLRVTETQDNDFANFPPTIDVHRHPECWLREEAGHLARSIAGWDALPVKMQKHLEVCEELPLFSAKEEAAHGRTLERVQAKFAASRKAGYIRRGGKPARLIKAANAQRRLLLHAGGSDATVATVARKKRAEVARRLALFEAAGSIVPAKAQGRSSIAQVAVAAKRARHRRVKALFTHPSASSRAAASTKKAGKKKDAAASIKRRKTVVAAAE